MWVTDTQVQSPGSGWRELEAAATSVGLIAVLLDDLRNGGGRPWDTGEFIRIDEPAPERYDPDLMFRQRWNQYVPLGSMAAEDREELRQAAERKRLGLGLHPLPEWLSVNEEDTEETEMFLAMSDPWGIQFPGLALAESDRGSALARDEAIRNTPAARIGLVVASRAADVPAVIGWPGAINHFIGDEGPVVLSAMMRSWEDRFGARLFRLGFDTMDFLVDRPPSSAASAQAVAAEHFAFAGVDGLGSQSIHTPSLRSLADLIVGNPTWHFWWD